jgi:hypothetical protein
MIVMVPVGELLVALGELVAKLEVALCTAPTS